MVPNFESGRDRSLARMVADPGRGDEKEKFRLFQDAGWPESTWEEVWPKFLAVIVWESSGSLPKNSDPKVRAEARHPLPAGIWSRVWAGAAKAPEWCGGVR